MSSACDACLRRTDLIAALGGHLDVEWRRVRVPAGVLGLPDDALLLLDTAGRAAVRYERFDADAARVRLERHGLTGICRHDAAYPDRLRELSDPPALLHVAGDVSALQATPGVAVVGARRASPYGGEVALALGRGLSAAGLGVVSGLALGIDGAAHAGALEVDAAAPVAVLAGAADHPYPARHRGLHERIRARGAVVSELPPGVRGWRWSFIARNRLIAGLAAATVVVEAAPRSGALTTADFAAQLGRAVAAVPGRVTSPLAAGTNDLIRAGAALVRDAADVLEELGLSSALATVSRGPAAPLEPRLQSILDALDAGCDTATDLLAGASDAHAVLSALTELELRGILRRGFGGRYMRVA